MRVNFAAWLLACAAVVPAAYADVSLSVSGSEVTVRGVTPNGEVVLFGHTHEYIGGTPHLGRHASVARDTDGDGVVTLAVESLPRHSVWVAVDQETGSHAVAGPDGQAPQTFELTADAWREGTVTVETGRDYLDFLLVRPGKGAWRLAIFQGSARDDDRKIDAYLRARIEELEHLTGKEKAPARASKKDVLVIIDPRTLELFVKAAE